jgi:nitrogen fixation/metabolism regulation signal transduction histidine kinase
MLINRGMYVDFSSQHNLLFLLVISASIVLVAVLVYKLFLARNRVLAPIQSSHHPIKWKNKNELMRLIEEYQSNIIRLKENTKKLAQSERETAWREMAKLVAHEIKNPLTPLKLGVQLLKKSWETKDPDFDQKFERFTDSFIEQIETLSNIVSEFSNFAKMPDMVLEKIDLKDLLEKQLAVYPETPPLKISLETELKVPVWIKADKNYLSRSFNNLIKNAMEAIGKSDGGIIVIRLDEDASYAYVAIEDNGSGIAEGLREHIFVPNFTTKTSGTGLGLAFVKQSLISIGGSIHFETETGKGTTFYIRIPLLHS